MSHATKHPKNFAKYPYNVKDIIEKDVLKDGKDDDKDGVVRKAYFLSLRLHDGQTRKGITKPDYITHPLQVYDLVKRCISNQDIEDKDVVLAAALLHDGIEEYKKDEVKKYLKLIESGINPNSVPKEDAGINPIVAREEATKEIRKAYSGSDEEFVNRLLHLINEVTNPVDFGTTKDGKIISKTKWQQDKIRHASYAAKLIKICDKTMSSVSNIEEVPNWDYDKVRNNISQSNVVVSAANENVKEDDNYYPAIEYATQIFRLVERGSREILKQIVASGVKMPPTEQFASFTLKIIEEMIRTGNTTEKPLAELGR